MSDSSEDGDELAAEEPRQNVRAVARVRLVLEFWAGPWGKGCALDQIYRQAARDALDHLPGELGRHGYRVVGAANVIEIVLRDSERKPEPGCL